MCLRNVDFYRIDTWRSILISSFLEIDFEINISDKKSQRFDLSKVIFKCIKVLLISINKLKTSYNRQKCGER